MLAFMAGEVFPLKHTIYKAVKKTIIADAAGNLFAWPCSLFSLIVLSGLTEAYA
ncbi:hypothetical protein DSUL_30061 [Desulfovibrionales bacterium]